VTLEPLCCEKCDAPVPLSDATRFACPYCKATVHVPAPYRELFEAHAKELATRHELEQRYAAAAKPPSRRIDRCAILLVLLAPAIAAATWVMLAHTTSALGAFVFGIVPALVPGTMLSVWSASVHATIVRFERALGADPPDRAGGVPRCRECGAPLAPQPGAISAHCAYCGTDSLIGAETAVAMTHRLETALRKELRTLADAILALRLRRRLVVGGAAAAVGLLAALVLVILAV
jgi:predicted RNA-binding Zn-ribbon protein involved in translation (DUF1610 family)